MKREKIKYANYPWVFWIRIRIRPKWFSYWWKSRGANYVEYQIWVFQVNIGRPWFDGYVGSSREDYGSAVNIHQSNMLNKKGWFCFLMKPPSNTTQP